MPSPSFKITGLGIAYPENLVPTEDLEKLAYKYHDKSPALEKVLAINRRTGIKEHSLIAPILKLPAPASIKEVTEIFLRDGVALALSAARLALAEAKIAPQDVTHIVATTCTCTSNPGFDAYLAQALGTHATTERVLLHGVGCAGGLAALRLAASLCRASAFSGAPANVLIVACEVFSTMRREELERVSREQEVCIGVTLLGDGAGAVVLSVDYGEATNDATHTPTAPGIYELWNTAHLTLPNTHDDLRFDVSAKGFAAVLTKHIPTLTAPCALRLLDALLDPNTLGASYAGPRAPLEFDWAIHPGGAAILAGIEAAVGLPAREHTRASWEVYERHGNTSSVSVLSVLDAMRRTPGRDWVVSMAFGPGVAAEGVLLRRL